MTYDLRPEQAPINQFGGLNTMVSEVALGPGQSPSMVNVDLHVSGSVLKRYGMVSLTMPVGVTSFVALMRLNQPEDGTGWIYAISSDGKLYRTPDPGTWGWEAVDTTPALEFPDQKVYGWAQSRFRDDATPTEYPSALYIPRSDGAPVIVVGAADAADDILEMPAGAYGDGSAGSGTPGYPDTWVEGHWPQFMRVVGLGRGARMWAWGFADDKNKAYYSCVDEPHNFLNFNVDDPGAADQPYIDGGAIYARRGDGDRIVSIVDMFSYTVIFKSRVTLLYTGDPGTDDWTLRAEIPVGCVNDRAWVKAGNELYFWSPKGLRALSAVQEYGDLQQSNLSWPISNLVNEIAPGEHDRIRCYHDVTSMKTVWFAPVGATAHNDQAFVHFYANQSWSRYSGNFCKMNDILVVEPTENENEKILGAPYGLGVVRAQAGYADIDQNVSAEYITNWHNFGPVQDSSRMLWIDAWFGNGGTAATLAFQFDLKSTWEIVQRITSSFGSSGTVWRQFKWGQAKWGVRSRAHRRFEAGGLFNMIRFKFYASSKTSFEIMGYRPEVRMRGPRA
jgi:hypothetical protein